MAGKAQLTIDVTATTSSAVSGLDKAKAAVKEYGDAADDATRQSRDVSGAIDSVGGVAGGATTGLRDMSDAIAMAGFPELAAGMGVTATALESLDGAATLYKAAQEGLSKSVAFFDGVMKALKLTILTNPIFIIAAIIIAIGAAFVLAYTKCETFRNIVDGAIDAVWSIIKAAYNWVKDNWPLLLTILTGPFGLAVVAIVKYRDEIWDAIKAVYDWFKDTWAAVYGFVTDVFTDAVSVVTGARDDIWDAVKSVYNWFRDTWNAITGWITGAFTSAVSTVTGARDDIWNGVKSVYNWFRDTWNAIKDWITAPFTNAKDTVIGVKDDIWTGFKAIYNWIRDSWDNIKDWLTAPFDDAWDTITGIVDDIKAAIQGVIDKIKLIKFPSLPSWLPGDWMQGDPAAFGSSAAAFAAPRVAGRGLGSTGASAGPGGVTINVTGALDPDAVARQIERILTGRARRVGGVNRTAGRL